ncbi:MAG: lactate utilization protein [Zoogloeaceae bacterium]|jgi:L-lactate dehydrogenase complex protein LldG|nr:lactate utilization protein [Zoogloeaceae bacterium]
MPEQADSLTARFRARAEALGGSVEKVSSLRAAPGALARYLVMNGLPTGGVCWTGLRKLDWIGAGLGMEDRPPRNGDLIGVTGCVCAIADSGELMLRDGLDTPVATSRLPEAHIAVVETARIVSGAEEAWALFRAEGGASEAAHFVAGPARAAAAPRRLHIILVGA